MSELNPNAISGLASNLNTKEIVGRFIEIEKRQIVPIEKRREQKGVELESWNAIQVELEKLKDVSKALTQDEIWEAKKVESSQPDVIAATAKRLAKPGKTTMAVDAVAMAHQITSQGFKSPDDNVGTGKISIRVGNDEDRTPVSITITESNNTLEGIKQTINDSGAEVEAFVIKTGSAEKPYQLMLTSKEIGEQGRISIEVNLSGGNVDPPSYKSSHDQTSDWGGIAGEEPATGMRGVGSSTPITGLMGYYEGDEDVEFTFTVAQSGTVNSEKGIEVLWTDSLGRQGSFKLNKYNYVPGSPAELVDGLSLALSDGEVIAGDSFTAKAFAPKSDLLWWMDEEQRAARVQQPSEWASKLGEGGIKISGKYNGDVDQTVVFRVEGGGQVGGPKSLILHYQYTETGESGRIDISHPYLSELNAGALESATAFDALDGEELFDLEFKTMGANPKKLSIGHDLFIEVPPGILNDGDTATYELKAAVPESYWWKDEELRGYNGKIDVKIPWEPYVDENGQTLRPDVSDGLLGFGRQKSTAPVEVSGEYTEDLARTYTFTVKKKGNVGITRLLELQWEDSEGNKGSLDYGEGYQLGKPVPFSAGLELAVGKGQLVEGDQFTVSTRTATVQRPQDAVLRLGASDLGGGIEIRRPSNVIDDIIPGVSLEIISTSKTPVTITVTGDTEKAKDYIRDFVDAFNTFSGTVRELTKYDQSKNIAGPLLSDRNVSSIYNDVVQSTTSSVPGLPQSDNMLFALGLKIDDKGGMALDESKLDRKIQDNFGAVANIFRTNGESDNSGVNFVGLTSKTKISPTGYKVDITQAPTRGTYLGRPLPPKFRIHEGNDELVIVAGGRKSDPIKLRQDVFTPASLARELQSKLADDKKLGKRRIQVMEEDGSLKIISGAYGSNSSIDVEPGKGKDISSLGLTNGISTEGKDVEGVIDGNKAEGRGQLLVGKANTDAEGLRLFVAMDQNQLKPGPEASIVITKGIGVVLDEKLQKVGDPVDGEVNKIQKNISEQMKNFDSQIKRLEQRIDAKQENLQQKFAKLESTLGRLNSQKSYIGQQFSIRVRKAYYRIAAT
ncbi:flagellar filament capping protein FliD, partial [Deltaproteobacteria bacterium TL4]